MTDSGPSVYEFSSGYYVVDELYAKPNDRIDTVVIDEATYGRLEEHYGSVSVPVVLKHGASTRHFAVVPSESVDIDTIELPINIARSIGLDSFTSLEQFLLAKPRHAKRLIQMMNAH